MTKEPGIHNREKHISLKIRFLLGSLTQHPLEYDRIAPKIEYWIEYVLREHFTTVDELVEGVSYMAWDGGGDFATVGRFLREFHDAPHRSEQARYFVTQLCPHVLRWFAIASVEYFSPHWYLDEPIASGGGDGFIRAASFVGHLVEHGLLSHDLVRQHLIKPLVNHHDDENDDRWEPTRINAIYQLFIVAGNTLLRGLLEAEDVQVCFEKLDARSKAGRIAAYDAARIQELRKIHDGWLQQKDVEERNAREVEGRQGEGEEDAMNADVPADVETPVALAPQDLPTTTMEIEIPSSILQDIEPPSVLHHMEPLPENFFDVPVATISSPTLSISTVSDLTPTELSEEIEHNEEQITTCHSIFYFQDGNVEVMCRNTLFRVHSTIISFSSPKLRDILSPPTLLHAPAPEGRPRITISESAEDFCILLKMIYTPGFPARHRVPEFTIFAPLLRMTTKYGFSEVRDQLLEDLRGAYPTKWEDFQGAKVVGEDVFGAPKPHPNAVLNLFVEQNVRFAIPFAAYRASVGGFSSLMSDKPGTVLPRRTLATTIHGMHTIRATVFQAARAIVHGGHLRVCPDKTCVLSVGMKPIERIEALDKVYKPLLDEREGGMLMPPSSGHLCGKCTKTIDAAHAQWGSICWEKLTQTFSISSSWDDL